jgi:hypothetical protein
MEITSSRVLFPHDMPMSSPRNKKQFNAGANLQIANITPHLTLNKHYIYLGAGVAQKKKSQCSVCLRTGRPGFDPRQRQRIFRLGDYRNKRSQIQKLSWFRIPVIVFGLRILIFSMISLCNKFSLIFCSWVVTVIF